METTPIEKWEVTFTSSLNAYFFMSALSWQMQRECEYKKDDCVVIVPYNNRFSSILDVYEDRIESKTKITK